MLIIGGSGNNRGALLGAVVVWGLWSVTGAVLERSRPRRISGAGGVTCRSSSSASLLAAVLVVRPRGLIGETKTVSRHLAK